MKRVFCSTGAIIGRANGRDFTLLRDIVPEIDCDGFELMFYSGWYGREAELVREVGSLRRSFPVLHCDKHIGELLAKEDFSEAERLFRINCEVARDVGAGILVLHLWNGIISDSNIEANFSALPELNGIAEECGVKLTCENVLAHRRTPLELIKLIYDRYPFAEFTYDTKMADFDNENGRAFEPGFLPVWSRVRHIHLNDRAGGYRDWSSIRALHLGEGQVDFEAFFENLARVGYEGDFTVEATSLEDNGTVRVDKMNRSLEKLRGYLGR